MRCKIALCAMFLGLWARIESCEPSGSVVSLVNGSNELIIAALVQTVYATAFSIGKTPWQDLYVKGADAIPVSRIKIVIIPPSFTGSFDSCKNGGTTYDRCWWIASDPSKLLKAIEAKTIKNMKNDILVLPMGDFGQFFVTREGKKLSVSTSGPGDLMKAMRVINELAGMDDVYEATFADKGSIPGSFGKMNERLKVAAKGSSSSYIQVVTKLTEMLAKINTYKEWQAKFATYNIKTEGYKKFINLLEKTGAKGGGLSEEQMKAARRQYELMALRIFAACEKQLLTDYRILICKDTDTSRTCINSTLDTVNIFFKRLKTDVLDPIKDVTGYDPAGRERMDLGDIAFTEGREQVFQNLWKGIVGGMKKSWEEIWNSLISKAQAGKFSKEDVPRLLKNVDQLASYWWEKSLEDVIRTRPGSSENGFADSFTEFKNIMDKKIVELKAALGITE